MQQDRKGKNTGKAVMSLVDKSYALKEGILSILTERSKHLRLMGCFYKRQLAEARIK